MSADDRESVSPGDGIRRTYLANERTYLAWWRSGVAALGVGLAIGRLVPDLTHVEQWPYTVMGIAYAVLGVAFVLYGGRRRRMVDEAIRTGTYAQADTRVMTAFTIVTAGIAMATAVVLVAVT